MESLLSAVLANLVLKDIETNVVENTPINILSSRMNEERHLMRHKQFKQMQLIERNIK